MSALHSLSPTASHAKPSLLQRFLQRLLLGNALWRQRQCLLQLDPSLLDDIGLNRADALAEAARPIWDVPQSWRN